MTATRPTDEQLQEIERTCRRAKVWRWARPLVEFLRTTEYVLDDIEERARRRQVGPDLAPLLDYARLLRPAMDTDSVEKEHVWALALLTEAAAARMAAEGSEADWSRVKEIVCEVEGLVFHCRATCVFDSSRNMPGFRVEIIRAFDETDRQLTVGESEAQAFTSPDGRGAVRRALYQAFREESVALGPVQVTP